MDRDALLRDLTSLLHVEADTVRAYTEALSHVDDGEVRNAFSQFRDEHADHRQVLVAEIARLGGELPERVEGDGHLAQWYASVRGMEGTEGAVHTMESAEKYNVRRYAEAVEEWDVGDERLAGILRRFYDQEEEHLRYVSEHMRLTARSS